MRIAVVGGTGDIGEGLALRFARDTDHSVLVGSREPANGRAAAAEYEETLATYGVEATIEGAGNETAAVRGDVVVLSVPPYCIAETVDAISADLDAETILVTPAVGMTRDDDGMHYRPPETGSVTELVANRAPEAVPVVGAYHNLPAAGLADLESDREFDTLVVADDRDARRTIAAITNELEGVRALEAGPLANAAKVERVTPLLITIGSYNEELRHVGANWI